jgi:hypothetical protein
MGPKANPRVKRRCLWIMALAMGTALGAQAVDNRIRYNGQNLFLSGANMAWVRFAGDIGPGKPDLATFRDVFQAIHDHKGNAMRLWLHTNGANTPEFNGSTVTGPGKDAIADLKAILDLAWEREVGLVLCLWSFDMLRASNGTTVNARSRALLTVPAYTQTYIDSALIPMVKAFKGHPGIAAWEIFNEPEGMSNEFGWSDIGHVPMSAIQRFVNLCAGAIHRTDPAALVTNGSWSFQASTDAGGYKNYYTDQRLIAAGGDTLGRLDFYSVHYYDWGGTALSPFHFAKEHWGLDKPLVVAEFAIKNTFGVAKESLYDQLHQTGYAGALAWSWTDVTLSTHEDIFASTQMMWDKYPGDVDVLGTGGDWPAVKITSPANNAQYSDNAGITITAEASDSDGSIAAVAFFYADTVKIGEAKTAPYTVVWKNMKPGNYVLTAVATDNQGHQRISDGVSVSVATPAMVKFEAETAARAGTGMTVKTDLTASNKAFLDIATQTGTVTWQLSSVPAAGTYAITIRYKLFYDHPKTQYLNVNGARAATVTFDAANTTTWYDQTVSVNLVQGSNTIQMELYWGWMYVDYLAVPASLVPSAVENAPGHACGFSLRQNFPNPFNPATTVRYTLPGPVHVLLEVFDVSGRPVAVLVDENQSGGEHDAVFDSKKMASGIYFYRLKAGNFTDHRRMLLLK